MPSADAPAPQSPYTLEARPAGAVCAYELTDTQNVLLGGDMYSGLQTKVRYVLRSEKSKKGIRLVAEVEHVVTDGRLQDVKIDLDSSRASDVRRISGGADATMRPDVVGFFAMIGNKIAFELDERGHLLKVEGGNAVRKRFLDYHPPKPRKSPHYIEKAKIQLSDEALAGFLLPYAPTMFEKGAVEDKRKDVEKMPVFDRDHRADALRARRIGAKDKRIVFEAKWQFAPSKEAHKVPEHPDANVKEFLGGNGNELVAFEAKNPCFLQAARTRQYDHNWHGYIDGETILTKRTTTRTYIWRKTSG